MKTTPPTRWSCRLFQYVRALAGNDSFAGRIAERHVAACPDCARSFELADGFDAALRHDAARQKQDPATGLDLRIIRSIEASARAPQRRRPAVQSWMLLAGAAAAIAVGIFTWQSTTVAPPSEPQIVQHTTPSSDASSGTHVAATAAKPVVPVTDLLKQDPLQVEVDSVYADARSAVQFLALNFLPSGELPQRNGA